MTLSQSLVLRVTLVGWLGVFFYFIVDLFNHSYFSVTLLGLFNLIGFPITIWFTLIGRETISKFLLLTILDLAVFVAVTSTPYDDAGRFFFVVHGLLSLLLFEREEKKSLFFGLAFPMVLYLLSFHIRLPGFPAQVEDSIAVATSRNINFFGTYAVALVEVYFFTKYISHLKFQSAVQSKFSALGVMSSGVAHEVNNPLMVVKGKATLLLRRLEKQENPDPILIKDIQTIERTADRIAKIVKGLQVFSRDSAKEPMTLVNSKTIVESALDLVSEKFTQDSVAIIVLAHRHFQVKGLETQLVQVLVNLLTNARDAVFNLEKRWIRVEIDNRAITVTDSGSGIPDEVATRIMQPFFTTKEIGKGTGLGLSISRGIMNQHRGDLILDRSSPHTKFIMQFSAVEESADPETKP